MGNSIKTNIQTPLKFVYSDNNSLSVIFHDNNLLLGVVGEFNKNLKELEKITGANLYSRGNSILIKSTNEKNEIILLDEVHTPDSSRYWIKEGYEERISSGKEPQNIDKEFLRLWFVDNCDPYNDDTLPEAPLDLVAELSSRYIYLYETITGSVFPFPNTGKPIQNRINENIEEKL